MLNFTLIIACENFVNFNYFYQLIQKLLAADQSSLVVFLYF